MANPTQDKRFFHPEYFINRELSWIEFNRRVLAEAQDRSQPLMERLRFLIITSSNFDEFFEVRVAGIKQQIDSNVEITEADGITAKELSVAIERAVKPFVKEQHTLWEKELHPALQAHGISIHAVQDLSQKDMLWAERYFMRDVFPVLTPLIIDASHPVPQLINKSHNLIVQLKNPQQVSQKYFAFVPIPRLLPFLIPLPSKNKKEYRYIYITDLVQTYIDKLFPGMIITGVYTFRITRNTELYIDEEEADNLLEAVEEELQKRNRGNVIRLEIEENCSPGIVQFLQKTFNLTSLYTYLVPQPLSFMVLNPIVQLEGFGALHDRSFKPTLSLSFAFQKDIFSVIDRQDVLLHHPYESFQHVIDFLERAADDPSVLAIKMTLYRTSGDSPIVQALIRAAENGKQVTVLIEIKARYDEANNINWAKRLEEAGAHVIYGVVGLKVHAKLILIVRQTAQGIKYYAHLSTGNYHPNTARFYSDLGLFTAHPKITDEVAKLFNILSGGGFYRGIEHIMTAPFDMQPRLLALIQREVQSARLGRPARIIAKMNSLVDASLISALYEASSAGVEIDLIVRGICCLRPGIPNVSERIRVISIIGRFLEHSRIYYFENQGQPLIYLGSADWMPRNLYRRIEVLFPILDPAIHMRITNEILPAYLSDNVKAHHLRSDGTYIHPTLPPDATGAKAAQRTFRSLARRQAAIIKGQLQPTDEDISQEDQPSPHRKIIPIKKN
ncbi:MAG: polyphosphate kinase 1 [Methylacidiphilales bacterium]|nr:polyphosphate kinase 1 [Candidatus Methylacidiphilales bacterium]MDW8348657.1 polyphosphate kinase 1 [Verrucomicrobiae bacterium]